jgi:hypothetical protein
MHDIVNLQRSDVNSNFHFEVEAFWYQVEVGQSELAPNQPLRWTFHCNLGSFNVLQSGLLCASQLA